MSNVTNIKVSFGRKIQTAPYENADAHVELTVAFDEGEKATLEDEIAANMDLAVSQVLRALRAEEKPKPAPAPAEKPKPAPAPAAKKESPPASPKAGVWAAPKAKQPSPSKPVDGSPKPYTNGDVIKAIGAAIDRLNKKGVTGPGEKVEEKIRSYLPSDAKPPFSYTAVPAHSFGDLIRDINDLGKQ